MMKAARPLAHKFIVIGHGCRLNFAAASEHAMVGSYYECAYIDFLEIWLGHWQHGVLCVAVA